MNTEFGTDDNTEQFKLHTTDSHKRKRIITRRKFYKKDSSIDILTQYTIFLITSCFFFWLRGFLNFAVSTASSSHRFVFWNRYPFCLPVRFQLLNLAVFFFCWFLSFCSDSAATNQCLFVFLPKRGPRFSLAIILWSLSSRRKIKISFVYFFSATRNWTTSFFFFVYRAFLAKERNLMHRNIFLRVSYLLQRAATHLLRIFKGTFFTIEEDTTVITWLERNKSSWSYVTARGD